MTGCLSSRCSCILRLPKKHQKLLVPYEDGGKVDAVVSPPTVVILHAHKCRPKTVNIDLVKPDAKTGCPDEQLSEVEGVLQKQAFGEDSVYVPGQIGSDDATHGYGANIGGHYLRGHENLNRPARY